MIIITQNITNKKTAYAENDDEFKNSLFSPVAVPGATNERGTLVLFKKIQERKNARLYWVTDSNGYFFDKNNKIWGQFSKWEKGKLFYQWTLDEITQQ